jgi:hypothetical protein
MTALSSNHLINTEPVPLNILEIHPHPVIASLLLATATQSTQILNSLLDLFLLTSFTTHRTSRRKKREIKHTSSMLSTKW